MTYCKFCEIEVLRRAWELSRGKPFAMGVAFGSWSQQSVAQFLAADILGEVRDSNSLIQRSYDPTAQEAEKSVRCQVPFFLYLSVRKGRACSARHTNFSWTPPPRPYRSHYVIGALSRLIFIGFLRSKNHSIA